LPGCVTGSGCYLFDVPRLGGGLRRIFSGFPERKPCSPPTVHDAALLAAADTIPAENVLLRIFVFRRLLGRRSGAIPSPPRASADLGRGRGTVLHGHYLLQSGCGLLARNSSSCSNFLPSLLSAFGLRGGIYVETRLFLRRDFFPGGGTRHGVFTLVLSSSSLV